MRERIKPNSNVPQLPLRENVEGEVLPTNLDGLKDGPEIHRILVGQKLWQGKPKRRTKVVIEDRRDNFYGVMDPESMRFIKASKEDKIKTKKRPAAIVLVTGTLCLDDEKTRPDYLEDINNKLTATGTLFVLEEKQEQGEFDLEWRLARLKNAGFVKTDVKHGLSDKFLLWRGRLKKKAKRTPTNLTESKRIEHYRQLWKDMRRSYRKHNYKVINSKDSEIVKEMKGTSFARQTISSLALGFGVEVRGEVCGCEWQVTMNGSWMNTKECKLDICQGPKEDIFTDEENDK